MVSDNGSQFASTEFANFADYYNFHHRTSSPHLPQSSGKVERAIRTVKRLLDTNSNLDDALLQYRSTPLANGFSLAELLFGRRLRTQLVMNPDLLQPQWPDISSVREQEGTHKQQQQQRFNTAHRAKDLAPLVVGDKIWVADLQTYTVVVEQKDKRSYIVTATGNGGTYRRNRRHLILDTSDRDQPMTEPTPHQQPQTPTIEVDLATTVPTNNLPDVNPRRSAHQTRPVDRLDL